MRSNEISVGDAGLDNYGRVYSNRDHHGGERHRLAAGCISAGVYPAGCDIRVPASKGASLTSLTSRRAIEKRGS